MSTFHDSGNKRLPGHTYFLALFGLVFLVLQGTALARLRGALGQKTRCMS